MSHYTRPEPLEARIAPAVYLVSAADTKVFDVTTPATPVVAMDLVTELSAAATVGADFAFLQQTGDKLWFDSNNNGKVDAKDLLVMQVDNGHAMTFFTDIDGDGLFSPDELTGMAVSDGGTGQGFKATIKVDVMGSIATVLDAADQVVLTGGKLTLQPDSITSLNITGAVTGIIGAGGSISNVTAGKPVFASLGNSSVGSILTGTEADDPAYSFTGSPFATVDVNPFNPTGDGGSISNLKLARGANLIAAGNGADSNSANGFAGGSISNVTITDAFESIAIEAGDGGDTSAANKAGGTGGAVTGVTITGKVVDGMFSINGGNGGDGSGSVVAHGGVGGAISNISLNVNVHYGSRSLESGSGGDASSSGGGRGGDSGAVSGITIKSSSFIDGSTTIDAGDGGRGESFNAPNPTTAFTIDANKQLLSFDVTAPGTLTTVGAITGIGTGETILGFDFRPVNGVLYVVTNDGTAGRLYTVDTATAVATPASTLTADPLDSTSPFTGFAGAAFGVDFNPVADRLRIVSDSGENLRINVDTGEVTTDGALNPGTPAISGTGYTNNVATATTTRLFDIDFGTDQLLEQTPPNNGTLAVIGSLGVNAAAVIGFDIRADNTAYALLTVGGTTSLYTINTTTGAASAVGAIGGGVAPLGLAIAPVGGGGNAGSISNVTFTGADVHGSIVVGSESMGGATEAGTAGSGSTVSALNITISTFFEGDVMLKGGNGGSVVSTFVATAGDGGSISNVTTKLPMHFGSYSVSGGRGGGMGGGGTTGGFGGSGGSATKITGTFATNYGDVSIHGGDGVSGRNLGGGGDGGAVSFVNLKATRIDGSIDIGGGLGAGVGGGGSANGAGGDGGSATDIVVKATRSGSISVSAGDGGTGAANGAGGNGGLVKAVNVNFTTTGSISVQAGDGRNAGNTAGAGGDGGSLMSVTLKGSESGSIGVGSGVGGSGRGASPGGDGGVVQGVTVTVPRMGSADIVAGRGGKALGASGAGGIGGTAQNVTVTASKSAGGFSITGGAGGDGAGSSAGGAGGSVLTTKFTAGESGGIDVTAGLAGTGGTGGTGGSIMAFTASVKQDLGGTVDVLSGGGGGGTAGNAGAAGGISSVKVTANNILGLTTFASGNGGLAQSSGTLAGNGGTISASTLTARTYLAGFEFAAGDGGDANNPGTLMPIGFQTAGLGGALQNLTVTAVEIASDAIFRSGDGGDVTAGTGSGGAGGEILNPKLTGKRHISTGVLIETGDGGDAATTGDGGAGGRLANAIISAPVMHGLLSSTGLGGEGGSASGSGGDGGATEGFTLTSTSLFIGDATLQTGDGGRADGGAAGDGGLLTRLTAKVTSVADGSFRLFGGHAGNGDTGGAGGNITNSTITLGSLAQVDEFTIAAGFGGDSTIGIGGLGGAVTGVTVTSSAIHGDVTLISGGAGGDSESAAAGGAGGEVSALKFTHSVGSLTDFRVLSGDGGDNSNANGTTGAGGAISNVIFSTSGNVEAEAILRFEAGDGGTATLSSTAAAAAGGSISTLKITDTRAYSHYIVESGRGGDNSGGDGAGGDAGTVQGITLAAALATVEIRGGEGGESDLAGGDGGVVETVTGKVGVLRVRGGTGGIAAGGAGIGGNGGDVKTITVTTTRFAQALFAGAGGDGGAVSGTGGNGGSVMDSKITGDIGNFAKTFGVDLTEMGGLLAGMGGDGDTLGTAGSIINVTATRIAAILAANESTNAANLTKANAVTAITNVHAGAFGADAFVTPPPGAINDTAPDALNFTFLDSNADNTFTLGSGDTALDGLIIVKSPDPALSPAPLKLIVVSP